MLWFFFFFLISGFCSILYELVWLRLSMAAFGVTTALTSIVLSVFMAGLGLGSWGGGRLIRRHGDRLRNSALFLYALIEFTIGVSALVVPRELLWGRGLLEQLNVSSSFAYYVSSGVWVALTLLPWCACMGATIPVGMLAIRSRLRPESGRSFSYLYMANVTGALAGAILPLLLIELYGFRGTLKAGATLNIALAAGAVLLQVRWPVSEEEVVAERATAGDDEDSRDKRLLWLLFTTGLTSMGMEVVWIRQFTPYVGTVVYAFATILAVYLGATTIGSMVYRRWSREGRPEGTLVWALLGLSAAVPLVTANPELAMGQGWRVLGVAPFSALLGFVTPMLVDRWAGGDPERAGSAYSVNVAGCILGPLVSGFVLLPLLNERWVLFLLCVPWMGVRLFYRGWGPTKEKKKRKKARTASAWPRLASYAMALIALVLLFTSKGFEGQFPGSTVLRDNTATVIATGKDMRKRLLINGVGITSLTPITKMMAHMPLAFLNHPPQKALVVCFGMGTTYRSLLSWGISATAVELVPSVPPLFGYFHTDGPELLRSPLATLVVDDGRRYLERTAERYDVVTLDPPPPVRAAGSSLLYSKEFYATIRQRLTEGGILQQWLPEGDPATQAAVAKALKESFPYVRTYRSVEGWGFHFLASASPIPRRTPEELERRMPAKAVADLLEWGPEPTAERQFAVVLGSELPLEALIAEDPTAPALQDDRPVNEYYLLRRERGEVSEK